jgi:hypothetical protein
MYNSHATVHYFFVDHLIVGNSDLTFIDSPGGLGFVAPSGLGFLFLKSHSSRP